MPRLCQISTVTNTFVEYKPIICVQQLCFLCREVAMIKALARVYNRSHATFDGRNVVCLLEGKQLTPLTKYFSMGHLSFLLF